MSNLLQIVETPPLAEAPFGLFSLQDPVMYPDEFWVGGFTLESRLCNIRQNYLDVCAGSAPVEGITPPVGADSVQTFTPYIIEAVDTCSTFGFSSRDVEERAVTALEAASQKAVEYELWTGELAQANGYADNRYLASSASTDVTPGAGGAVKVRWGLAALEKALADCSVGTRGVIHMPRDVASALTLRVVDDHLETQLGNYVVAGSGYPGTGPTGSMPANGTWMYATGPVAVTLGSAQPLGTTRSQQVTTSVNTWEARAVRPAAAVWDGCCAFAVNVDLALDYA